MMARGESEPFEFGLADDGLQLLRHRLTGSSRPRRRRFAEDAGETGISGLEAAEAGVDLGARVARASKKG
jgi:hypothetical protein